RGRWVLNRRAERVDHLERTRQDEGDRPELRHEEGETQCKPERLVTEQRRRPKEDGRVDRREHDERCEEPCSDPVPASWSAQPANRGRDGDGDWGDGAEAEGQQACSEDAEGGDWEAD